MTFNALLPSRFRGRVLLAGCLLALSPLLHSQTLRIAPASGKYCIGAERVEYRITDGNVLLRHGGREYRGLTAYSYFGRQPVPAGFVTAFLLNPAGNDALLFTDRLEWRGQPWRPCPEQPAR